MKSVLALVPAAIVAGALMNVPAEAKCEDHGGCVAQRLEARAKASKAKPKTTQPRAKTAKPKRTTARPKGTTARAKATKTRTARVKSTPAPATRGHGAARARKLKDLASKRVTAARAFNFDPPNTETGNSVVAMIKSMSPGYGVPSWFALRIAKIESNYNPNVRGSAGEYGIYQIKCNTARGLGFSGGCSELADARTNIHWGLRHLAEALKSSAGNLKLAASKHNGGLGRRTIVPHYVNMVF